MVEGRQTPAEAHRRALREKRAPVNRAALPARRAGAGSHPKERAMEAAGRIVAALLPLALGACIAGGEVRRPAVEHYPVDESIRAAARAAGSPVPFSSAVRVGDVLYLSGQIGVGPDGRLPSGIEAQSRQTMENIRAVLGRAGLGFGDVFRCLVMIEDMKDWPAFNRVYVGYFEEGRLPARSAFGADGLALGALVEVECQAHAPLPRER
jgi:reactive intermediate/imine deaminase